MKLHGNLNSPFGRMCMVTAIECGLASKVQLKLTSVIPNKVQEELERLSPLAKVPVLEIENGKTLYDSRVIMEYFCYVGGNRVLLPAEGNGRFHVLNLLALAQGLCDAAVGLRYETAVRPEGTVWPEFAQRQSKRVSACIADMEVDWLAELEQETLGSIAAGCALAYLDLRNVSPGWREKHKRLASWLDAFSKRQSFQNTLPPG